MSEDGGYMDGYNDGLIDGREPKPLRWRSGYLPDDFSGEVIIEMYDGTHRIYDLGERERFGMKRMAYKWLPLSEILELIGE